jgi:F0F1-type ATP synthase membrane subunit c/vacuolar-type H+-ATPase subunit K
MDTLVHQAGLPYAGLAYHGHDLAVSSACLIEGLAQGGEFGFASHKAGETPRGRGLEPSAKRASSNELTHLHRLR